MTKKETINQKLCRIYKVKYKKEFDENSRQVLTERQRLIEKKKMEFLKKIVNKESLVGYDEKFKKFWFDKVQKANNIPDGTVFKHEDIWTQKNTKG